MRYKVFDEGFLYCLFVIFRWKKGPVLIHFYRNTLMLASGIKGIRVQLGIESDPSSTIFMRRRLGCPVCLQRGASPPFDMKMGLTHTYAAAISEVHVLTTSYPAFSSNLIIDRSFLFVARSLASSAPVS